MKKTLLLLSLSAFIALGITSACDGPAGTACNNDDDCNADAVCFESECQATQCNGNADCDLSAFGDAIAKTDLDAGNTECEDQGLVTIVTFDGSEACITGADAAVGCGEGLARVDATAPGGSTVEVCVSGDGVCELGTCT